MSGVQTQQAVHGDVSQNTALGIRNIIDKYYIILKVLINKDNV